MTIVAHADRAPRPDAEGVGPRQAQRVLILEDHGMIAMLMVEVLRGMGHRVCAIAATPSAATAAATRHLPDLMIVDVHLQDGSGPATVRKILALNGFVPHVFITGQEAQPGAPWPAGTVLRKPFGAGELGQAIQHLLHAASPVTAVGAMAQAGSDGPGR